MPTNTEDETSKSSPSSSATASKTSKSQLSTPKEEKPFKCLLCPYAGRHKSALKTHSFIHSGEKPFKCTVCSYQASQRGTLNDHMRTHTGEKPFKCTQCSYSAKHRGTLNEHLRTHTGEKPYKCTLCSYSARHLSTLKGHIMCTHTGEKPFKCSLCSYSCSLRVSLRRHMRTHNGPKPNQSSILRAQQPTREGEPLIKCLLCPFTTNDRNMVVHKCVPTEGKVKCSLCSYTTNLSSHLMIHMHTHIGEKVYGCMQCSYIAHNFSDLQNHMRLLHSGENPVMGVPEVELSTEELLEELESRQTTFQCRCGCIFVSFDLYSAHKFCQCVLCDVEYVGQILTSPIC